MSERAKIAVLGGGAWGTALAAMSAIGQHETWLYARDAETVAHVNDQRRNPAYLGEIELPEGIRASTDARLYSKMLMQFSLLFPRRQCAKVFWN